jgi:hypothetical protein
MENPTFWIVIFRYIGGQSTNSHSVLASSQREAYAKTVYRHGIVRLISAMDLGYGA